MSTIDGVTVVNGNPYVKSQAGRKTGRFLGASLVAVPMGGALAYGMAKKKFNIKDLFIAAKGIVKNTNDVFGKVISKLEGKGKGFENLSKAIKKVSSTKAGRIAILALPLIYIAAGAIGGGLIGRVADMVQNHKAKKVAKSFNA